MKKTATKEDFCKNTHTSDNCWMFQEVNPKSKFYSSRGMYYFDNGINKIRRFKDMPKYGEVWISVADRIGTEVGQFGIWTVWTQY